MTTFGPKSVTTFWARKRDHGRFENEGQGGLETRATSRPPGFTAMEMRPRASQHAYPLVFLWLRVPKLSAKKNVNFSTNLQPACYQARRPSLVAANPRAHFQDKATNFWKQCNKAGAALNRAQERPRSKAETHQPAPTPFPNNFCDLSQTSEAPAAPADPDEKVVRLFGGVGGGRCCLLYTSPSPRDGLLSRMPSSA